MNGFTPRSVVPFNTTRGIPSTVQLRGQGSGAVLFQVVPGRGACAKSSGAPRCGRQRADGHQSWRCSQPCLPQEGVQSSALRPHKHPEELAAPGEMCSMCLARHTCFLSGLLLVLGYQEFLFGIPGAGDGNSAALRGQERGWSAALDNPGSHPTPLDRARAVQRGQGTVHVRTSLEEAEELTGLVLSAASGWLPWWLDLAFLGMARGGFTQECSSTWTPASQLGPRILDHPLSQPPLLRGGCIAPLPLASGVRPDTHSLLPLPSPESASLGPPCAPGPTLAPQKHARHPDGTHRCSTFARAPRHPITLCFNK